METEKEVLLNLYKQTGKEGRRYHASWGGECTFHTNIGCELGIYERPLTCKMLEPQPDGECIIHEGGKRSCAISWIPYYSILDDFLYEDINIER